MTTRKLKFAARSAYWILDSAARNGLTGWSQKEIREFLPQFKEAIESVDPEALERKERKSWLIES